MSRIIGSRKRSLPEAGLRLLLFLAWSALLAGAWMLRRTWIPKRSRTAVAARWVTRWSRGVLAILEVRVTVEGIPHARPFFLVSNHLGYLDIAVIAGACSATFVSKAEVAAWPVFGQLASLAGTLFLDRKSQRDARRVGGLIPGHFANGGSLVLFPEGTSSAGHDMKPFRSPLFDHPAAAGMPVHCAALRYHAPLQFPPAAFSMCWWGDATFVPHFLRLFRMRGMLAELSFAPAPVRSRDRKVLARLAEAEVRKRLGYLLREAGGAGEARRDASLAIARGTGSAGPAGKTPSESEPLPAMEGPRRREAMA